MNEVRMLEGLDVSRYQCTDLHSLAIGAAPAVLASLLGRLGRHHLGEGTDTDDTRDGRGIIHVYHQYIYRNGVRSNLAAAPTSLPSPTGPENRRT